MLTRYQLTPCARAHPRHVCEGELAILMLLAKLSFPRALRPDMEHWFLQDKTRLSRFIRRAMEHVFTHLAYTLSFDKRRLHRDIPQMAYAMGEAIGVPNPGDFRVWGLVDGVFRKMSRPKYR